MFIVGTEIQRETTIHAIGRNLEFSLNASVGVTLCLKRVNSLVIRVIEYYTHLLVFERTHQFASDDVKDCGKLDCLARTIDIEIGKHSRYCVSVGV